MNDRDVMNKIIAKIKALENVISGGGGGESAVFLVTTTYDSQSGDTSLDKTYSEILNANNSGKVVMLQINEDGATYILYLTSCATEEGQYIVNFGEQSYTSDSEDGILNDGSGIS